MPFESLKCCVWAKEGGLGVYILVHILVNILYIRTYPSAASSLFHSFATRLLLSFTSDSMGHILTVFNQSIWGANHDKYGLKQ